MTKDYWFPSLLQSSNWIYTDSWYDLDKFKCDKHHNTHRHKSKIKTHFLKSIKIKIYPTDKQIKILVRWFDLHTAIYNLTNNYIKPIYKSTKKIDTFYNVREHFTDFLHNVSTKNNIYRHTLDQAVKHCLDMYKSGIEQIKSGYRRHFDIKDLKYDRRRKNVIFESNTFSKVFNGIGLLGKLQSDSPLSNINHNCILQYDSYKKVYYMIIPKDESIDKNMKRKDKCGIDLGVRTFATIYSGDRVRVIGNHILSTIDRYNAKIADLHSALDVGAITKAKYKKVRERNYEKMRNRIDDMHKKTAVYLCKQFDVINIGKVSIQSMTSNLTGNIGSITKRRLLVLSFYKFYQILRYIGIKYGTKINEVNEYMTSKKCHRCGNIKKDLGANKIYACNNKKCGIKLDRDVNASINIYKM
jgi:putative transposase